MKENKNKGYFLVEAVILLAVVSSIITTLYISAMSIYIKNKNEIKYNTVDGLYSANAIKKYLYSYEDELSKYAISNGYVNVSSYIKQNYNLDITNDEFIKELNVNKIYLSLYSLNKLVSSNELNSSINDSLSNIQNDNKCTYRYVIIYNDESYAFSNLDCK